MEYRGATFEEMDLDAVLARRPAVALVDELAHTNAPGGRHEKRLQDIEALLDAGIDVISTVNVQHLESPNDVVERIAGVVQRETVPDAVVRDRNLGRAGDPRRGSLSSYETSSTAPNRPAGAASEPHGQRQRGC